MSARKAIDGVLKFADEAQRHALNEEIGGTGSVVLVLDCKGKLYRYGNPPPDAWESSKLGQVMNWMHFKGDLPE